MTFDPQKLFVDYLLGSLFSEQVIYKQDMETMTCNAIIDRDALAIDYSTEGEAQLKTAKVTLSLLGDYGLAEPALGDTVTFDGNDWLVSDIDIEQIDKTVVLTVKRRVVVERSREKYRSY